MIKNKFILLYLAACVAVAPVYADAYTHTYEKDDASGRMNVRVLLDGKVLGVLSPTGYNEDSVGDRIPAQYSEVQNSVVEIKDGANCTYLICADAHNEGIVYGTRTINMSGGYAYGLIGGHAYYKYIDADFKPYNSTEDVVINLTGGSVTRVNGGGLFSVDGIIDAEGNKIVKGTQDYIEYMEDSTFAVGGDVYINVLGDGVVREELYGGGSYASVNGKVRIVFGEDSKFGTHNTNEAEHCIFGGAKRGAYVGSSEIIIKDNADINGRIYGGSAASSFGKSTVKGDTAVFIQGGIVRNSVFGAGQEDVILGCTKVSISDGEVTGNVYGGGSGSTIEKGTNVTLSGGTVGGTVYGTGENDTVKGDVTISLLGGDWSGIDIVAVADGAKIENGSAYLIVGNENAAYHGSVKSFEGFDHLVVHRNSSFDMGGANIFAINTQTITLSAVNLRQAAVTGGFAAVGADGVTLDIRSAGRLRSGKYMVATVGQAPADGAPAGWNAANVTVQGIAGFDDFVWEASTLYLNYVSPYAYTAAEAGWGVFKSSQAFTGALWGNRNNAVVLDAPAATPAPAPVANDGKAPIATTELTPTTPSAITLAWGTVYGQSGRISGEGADYSLYGAAIGAERLYANGTSICLAFGYDWGKVSPFTCRSVDQDTWHAALYGRVGAWKVGKGTVAVDWSAAYGDTTSEHSDYSTDWSQSSWQLDVRATYAQALSERAIASVFAGTQYYTHDDTEVDGMEISSMQNLRLQAGAGVSYAATAKTTVYGQACAYFDAMRHNPYVDDAGVRVRSSNPGRIGGVFSVGAEHAISEQWSLRGSYSFDVAKDSTEHNVNVGAQYRF